MITATPGIIGDLAVETDGLVKTFGATRAVDGVNLAIPRGSVYGVLGPTGAGKTTTIRILATLLRPAGGRARYRRHQSPRCHDRTDVLEREPAIYPEGPHHWLQCGNVELEDQGKENHRRDAWAFE